MKQTFLTGHILLFAIIIILLLFRSSLIIEFSSLVCLPLCSTEQFVIVDLCHSTTCCQCLDKGVSKSPLVGRVQDTQKESVVLSHKDKGRVGKLVPAWDSVCSGAC